VARRTPPEGAGGIPDPTDVELRRIQPYDATKTYRCPGCDQVIAEGVGHLVVVPRGEPDLRRHWHTPCWTRLAPASGDHEGEQPPPTGRPTSARARRAARAEERRRRR
jgi:hypothetical protein